jgi:hypothetical protein
MAAPPYETHCDWHRPIRAVPLFVPKGDQSMIELGPPRGPGVPGIPPAEFTDANFCWGAANAAAQAGTPPAPMPPLAPAAAGAISAPVTTQSTMIRFMSLLLFGCRGLMPQFARH